MNPLNNHRHSLILGIVLAVLLAAFLAGGVQPFGLGWARWIHIVSGVFWIGLLYYFNAVQTPALADAAADKGGPGGAGITKYVAPKALFWFRWSALATWLAGFWLLAESGRIGAFALAPGQVVIGIGAWLGTIMLLNVWGIIWPNQKKALGIVQADADAKKKAARLAMLTSRVNTMLSIPMLYCMVAQQNIG
jgi:uncharacterized membrane protein